MSGRLIHYSEPVEFHKAMPGAKSVVIWKRDDGFTPAVSSTAKPKNIPNTAKRETPMVDYGNDISRGPYHSMIDKMARARQAITGESYAKAFTETYCDPSNSAIRDGAQYDHLAKGHDAMFGTRLSTIPVAKAAPAYDPLAKSAELAEIRGPAHAKLHSMAVDHQRAHAGQSYASAYAYLYAKPENEALRDAVKAEHMSATMAGVGSGEVDKAAPMDALQDDVDSEYELRRLVVTRMKNEPGMSYARAFTREYLDPANRSLKARVSAEGLLRMQAIAPARPFPAYTAPGHAGEASNVGRSGAKPRGYIGG